MLLQLVFLAISTALTAVWFLVNAKAGKKFAEYLAPLKEDKSHPFYELYSFGFELLAMVNYKYDSPLDRKRIAQCNIIYGEKFGGYYYSVNLAEKLSLSYAVLVVFFALYGISGEPALILVGLVGMVLAYLYVDSIITSVIEDRQSEIELEFADMVSKLTLLVNAGMIMREAWARVADTSDGLIYREMHSAIQQINNGMAEVEAYVYFGNRCETKRVKKFASMLVQNLTKGNHELVSFLKQTTKESWEERKNIVKRKGEAAATKLLIPIGIMFVGLLIMIVVPVFTKIGN